MTQCKRCGDALFSDDFDKCRGCIVDKYEELIQDVVTEISDDNMRHLNTIHTEIRNRVIKRDE